MSDAATLHDGDFARGEFRLDRLSRQAARTPIGPVRIGDDLVMLRQARWSDGPAWCRTRQESGERMRATFGESTLITWAEHLLEQRRAVRAGLRVPFLAVHADGRVIGEVNFHLDPSSGSAEISIWFGQDTPRPVSAWVAASALFRLYALPARIPRTIAPIATANPGPRRLLAHYGFSEVSMARELRAFGGRQVDHDIWWLSRDADHLAGLARGLTETTL